jgi:hypothetical protein
VRIDVPERLVLLAKVLKQLHNDRVFQHVCVIACVEGVSITKHGGE